MMNLIIHFAYLLQELLPIFSSHWLLSRDDYLYVPCFVGNLTLYVEGDL